MDGRRRTPTRTAVTVVLVLALSLWVAATASIEAACYRVKPGAKGFHRRWVWVPLPHWACAYPDGSTTNFWPWDAIEALTGP